MKIIEPSYRIEWPMSRDHARDMMRLIEGAARTCYKSAPDPDRPFKVLRGCTKRGHLSVIEHSQMTVRFIANRGFTHEMVRHRLAAFSQESTRYCDYSQGKHGGEVTFIAPSAYGWVEGCGKLDSMALEHQPLHYQWLTAMHQAETTYLSLLKCGARPEQARGVLPIDLKTEIVVSANLREWRHIFKLRTAKAAHPQMRQLMRPLLADARTLFPVIFDDVGTTEKGKTLAEVWKGQVGQ